MTASQPQPATGVIEVRTIVGLEIHVQLATRSKLFCGCAVEVGAPPNSRLCPVCLGMPGALPVINRQAIEYAVLTGLALNCSIAERSRWDRKHYFYRDLPKNYQISQYNQPLATDGWFDLSSGGTTRRIRIRRAHLEEDAGKSIHDSSGNTLVDLNRAGTPLLEIVTEPDIESAEQAHLLCAELQRLVRALGVSEAVMQKGQMRFEPNVNLAIVRDGIEYRTPITEIKNLNSFRAVRAAIEHESQRQFNQWIADPSYLLNEQPNENRGWSDEEQCTVFQRGKEAVRDYRYFPDPDLPPVTIEKEWIERLAETMPELPQSRRARLVERLGLSAWDADVIIADRRTADLFDEVVSAGAPPKLACKQFINIWCKLAGDRSVSPSDLGLSAEHMAALARLVDEGKVSASAASTIAPAMVETKNSPAELAESMGLVKVRDEAQTQAWVDQAIQANPKALETLRTNPKKIKATQGFLNGQVMRISEGRADPTLARELLQKRLQELLGRQLD